tara:strand:- start:2115 stop:2372 length:258 start_codon:yes stop_codon:yes gene_type:complete
VKEINVRDIIKQSNIELALAKIFAKKLNIDEEAALMYIDKKINNKLQSLGEKMSSGDMSPQEYNQLRRLSDVDISQISDRIIKDK